MELREWLKKSAWVHSNVKGLSFGVNEKWNRIRIFFGFDQQILVSVPGNGTKITKSVRNCPLNLQLRLALQSFKVNFYSRFSSRQKAETVRVKLLKPVEPFFPFLNDEYKLLPPASIEIYFLEPLFSNMSQHIWCITALITNCPVGEYSWLTLWIIPLLCLTTLPDNFDSLKVW